MFEDSLIESGGRLRTKRGRTTTLAFILEICLVAILILIPLIYTEALPMKQLMATVLVAPPPPPPPPPPPAAAPVIKVVKQVQTDIVNGQLRTPTKIPEKVKIIKEEEAPPPMAAVAGVVGGVPGGVPGGQMGGVIGGIVSSAPMPVPKVAAPQKIKVSQGVAQGNLIHEVKPSYPPIAKAARVQGQVVLQATISKNGQIENLRVVSGHPMLVQSALDAVKQWRYKPYMLNGDPVEVETQITVNFTLSG
jgi:periplasmic protein TonB